jgi:hypothetical protein
MDIFINPEALLIFYSVLTVGCGGALGFILGRALPRRSVEPLPPHDHERRLKFVEEELELARRELLRLRAEHEFRRELKAPDRMETDSLSVA